MSFKTKDCKLWLIHFSLAELFFVPAVVTKKGGLYGLYLVYYIIY